MTAEAFARIRVGAQLDLRVDPRGSGRLPFALPLEPNTVAERDDGTHTLWLGPDEWLLLGPGPASDVIREIERALEGFHHSVVDVSENRVILELSGPGRHDLLSAGCGLDLHPRSWGAGQCAQTLLARVPVTLWETDASTRVLVRPSFADHLVDWLVDQAAGVS